jgi:hypothetical protein
MKKERAGDDAAPDAYPHALARRFVGALAARDFAGVARCFASDVRMRGLIPSGLREREGASDAAALFEEWFGACDPIETLDVQAETVADRLRIAYRFRLVEDGAWYEVQQQAFCTLEAGRIAAMDVMCSGFRPIEAAAS